MKLIKYLTLVITLIAIGCVPIADKNQQTLTPAPIEASSTAIATSTVDTIQPANFYVQCLDVQPPMSQKMAFTDDVILLQDYNNKKSLFAIHPSKEGLASVTYGEGFLAPIISPNNKILAFLKEVHS